MRSPAYWLFTGLIALGAATTLARETLATPASELGFSPERLARLDTLAQTAIDEGIVAGAVILVQRNGQVAYHRAFGLANTATSEVLEPEDLFRIASMTKAITSLGVMMLFEEGKFLLEDPVGRYLPSFDKSFDVVQPTQDGYELVPANGPITIRQLLTHTSGLSYRFMNFEPLTRLYTEAGISDGLAGETLLLANFVKTLAGQPLAHHPGEAWTYGLSTDVLGRLIEVVSGQTLDRFMAERIFAPLGMEDTYFEVPPAKRDRVAAVHRRADDGSLQPIPDGRVEDGPTVYDVAYPYDGQTGFLCGGAGLTSTAGDYAHFLQMLLNGGELNGQRLLGRKTVELMTSNQVWYLDESAFDAAGFTLGFRLDRGPEGGQIQSANSLGWGGFWNTDFWFDPQEDLVGILMTQHYPYGHRLMDTYKVAIYQALLK